MICHIRAIALILMVFAIPSPAVAGTGHMPVEQNGWNGGDAAYNRPLPEGGRLWVFGDSLLGRVADGERIAPDMARNSVAVEDAQGRFSYYTGKDGEGVFINGREGEWYWPADFVLLDEGAYFFLRRIRMTGEGAMDFAVTGTDVAKVANVADSPDAWEIAYSSFARDGVALGVAVGFDKDYLYLLANDASASHAFYLARIARLAMKNQLLAYSYYDPRRKQWAGSVPKTALIADGAPEASLVRAEDGQWRLVYSGDGLSRDILLRTAPAVTGPWSAPLVLHSCPEAQGDIICYAGKEVQGASRPTITYSVNALDPAALEADASLYIPRIVTLDAW